MERYFDKEPDHNRFDGIPTDTLIEVVAELHKSLEDVTQELENRAEGLRFKNGRGDWELDNEE